eukprot:TRINITY_DN45266_c0_g1_i2.p1 TRINITY_DN45266_c0_g1~~TRINITY_DN45266_c0_g1_i2.p1  ORF type:complete len:407 (+),score=81.26 TRINITY_DN45266_c0_g1_i2:263-1483(+)
MNPHPLQSTADMTLAQRKKLDLAFEKLSVRRNGVQVRQADILSKCTGPLAPIVGNLELMITEQDGDPMVGKRDWEQWADDLVRDYAPSDVDTVIGALGVPPVGWVPGVSYAPSVRKHWQQEEKDLVECFLAYDSDFDGVLSGREVVSMRDRDTQKFLTRAIDGQQLLRLEHTHLTEGKSHVPLTRADFLGFFANLGAEYDEDVSGVITDLQGQIEFMRGDLSAGERHTIESSFRRLCCDQERAASPSFDHRAHTIPIREFDPEVEAPRGSPVILRTSQPSRKKGQKRVREIPGLFNRLVDEDRCEIVVDGKVMTVGLEEVTIYISWEELMILAKQAKQTDLEQFQRSLERMARRSQGSKDDQGSSTNMSEITAPGTTLGMRELGAAPENSKLRTCRTNCVAGCQIM